MLPRWSLGSKDFVLEVAQSPTNRDIWMEVIAWRKRVLMRLRPRKGNVEINGEGVLNSTSELGVAVAQQRVGVVRIGKKSQQEEEADGRLVRRVRRIMRR